MKPTVVSQKLDVYTVREAADLLGVSYRTVHRMLDDGALTEIFVQGQQRDRLIAGASVRQASREPRS